MRTLWSDLIDPTIAVHNGRVIKRTGDGALVEFRSVVDAVRCAIEVQNGLVERNASGRRSAASEFRVGIHLGDVVEEADRKGDGACNSRSAMKSSAAIRGEERRAVSCKQATEALSKPIVLLGCVTVNWDIWLR